MGNQVSLVPKVSYEDLQMVVYRNMHVQHSTLIINTLPPSLQHCLIKTTVDIRFDGICKDTTGTQLPEQASIRNEQLQVLHRIEGQILVEHRPGGHHRACDHQHAAVGRAFCHQFGADHAAGAGADFDHDGLPEHG